MEDVGEGNVEKGNVENPNPKTSAAKPKRVAKRKPISKPVNVLKKKAAPAKLRYYIVFEGNDAYLAVTDTKSELSALTSNVDLATEIDMEIPHCYGVSFGLVENMPSPGLEQSTGPQQVFVVQKFDFFEDMGCAVVVAENVVRAKAIMDNYLKARKLQTSDTHPYEIRVIPPEKASWPL